MPTAYPDEFRRDVVNAARACWPSRASGRDWARLGELAESLQLRQHSVVELVDRAQAQCLVRRRSDPDDARAVRVQLTVSGERLLARLGPLHLDELRRMHTALQPPD